MIVNESDYSWSRVITTVGVGTTAFEQPMKIYAAKGDGTLWLDAEATQAVESYPIAVDEITVTGAEMKLIGEQGRGSPVSAEYLDTAEGMTALEWSSRTDTFALTLPFTFLWNGAEVTEITLYAHGTLCLSGTTHGIRVHDRYSWSAAYAQPTNGLYYQSGESGSLQFLKIRFDGFCYYSYTTDEYKSVYEVFLLSDGTVFINSVQSPTITVYSRFYVNSTSTYFTASDGAQLLAASADGGVTWAFETLEGGGSSTLFLVRKNGGIYTAAGGTLTAVEEMELTAAVFLEYGFESLSDFTPEGEYSVLSWSAGTAPTLTATVSGTAHPQEMTCAVELGHASISGIQQITAEYSGTVELCHRVTGGEWTTPVALSDWVAQDKDALYNSVGEDGMLYLKFYLYGGAEFTLFRMTFIN